MFDKMKQLLEMQRKMQELKRELENTAFEIASPDGAIKIVMSGSQEVKEVVLATNLPEIDRTKLERSIKDTYNKAIKRSQEIATEKMKNVTGINLPGLT